MSRLCFLEFESKVRQAGNCYRLRRSDRLRMRVKIYSLQIIFIFFPLFLEHLIKLFQRVQIILFCLFTDYFVTILLPSKI
jgi:hypothetical protein